jgi:predicted DNA-binding transcriptional regulator AlpA
MEDEKTVAPNRKAEAPSPEEIEEIIVSDAETCRIVNLSPTTIWRLEQLGKFPKKVKLSERRGGRLKSEIIAWIKARAAERGAS